MASFHLTVFNFLHNFLGFDRRLLIKVIIWVALWGETLGKVIRDGGV